jgi:penicillin amidase
LHETFPADLADFLNSSRSEWDTPMQGAVLPPPAPPDAAIFSLRELAGAAVPLRTRSDVSSPREADAFAQALGFIPPDEARGSNNWVVAGSRTAGGQALLSNDMHLSLGVPNIWYRASLKWTDDRGAHHVTGATLPGVPSMIDGSNGLIAWGFTNTTADWSDRVLIDPVPGDPSR